MSIFRANAPSLQHSSREAINVNACFSQKIPACDFDDSLAIFQRNRCRVNPLHRDRQAGAEGPCMAVGRTIALK